MSVRFLSEVLGRLAVGEVEAELGQLESAARRLPEIIDLVRRGIDCGALPDPWNILGFQGLFPLSPAREDSVRDNRLDELCHVIELSFNLYARLMSEAAAAGSFGSALRSPAFLVARPTISLSRASSPPAKARRPRPRS